MFWGNRERSAGVEAVGVLKDFFFFTFQKASLNHNGSMGHQWQALTSKLKCSLNTQI